MLVPSVVRHWGGGELCVIDGNKIARSQQVCTLVRVQISTSARAARTSANSCVSTSLDPTTAPVAMASGWTKPERRVPKVTLLGLNGLTVKRTQREMLRN